MDDASAKLPWTKFYPTAWRADPGLRVCSLAARGLWMDMLTIMFEAEPRGSLVLNGRPLTVPQLAAMAAAPLNDVTLALDELRDAGVFSQDDDGVIYSRRIRRDEAKSAVDKANGKMGGNPALKRGGNGGDNGGGKGRVKARVKAPDKAKTQSLESESRVKNLESKKDSRDADASRVDGHAVAAPETIEKDKTPANGERRSAEVELIQDVVTEWNGIAGPLRLPAVQHITGPRQAAILARAKDLATVYDFSDPRAGFRSLFTRIRASPFLRGEVNGFRVDLDFAVRQSSFTRIMEGRYEGEKRTRRR
jgi:hypothetical protein